MLHSLIIKNYALIADLEVELGDRLNIMTGETGAGKSIILGALSIILGERVDTTMLRQGAMKAIVEGKFVIAKSRRLHALLADNGLDSGDDLLILRREIHDNGRSRAFVNDSPVQLSQLQEIGDYLVDLHGQHEHQSLLKIKNHLRFLDEFAGLESDVEQVRSTYAELQSLLRRQRELEDKQRSAQEKRDYYRFQIAEIDKVAPSPDEEKELLREEKLSRNSERLHSLSDELCTILYEGDHSIFEQMGQAQARLDDLGDIDDRFTPHNGELESAKVIVEELAKFVQEYKSRIEFNPEQLEQIQNRIAILSGLKKKYSRSLEEILTYRDQIGDELKNLENLDEEIENARRAAQAKQKEFSEHCLSLSEQRKAAAKKLEQIVPEILAYLGMPGSRFKVAIEYQDDPNGEVHIQGQTYRANADGMDLAQFHISTNSGIEPKPLAKVASGGEISRIMLALKSVMAKQGQVPVLIFDEIDIGVSGRIAQSVGRKLKELSEHHQVICITHLPQIASMGNHHFMVEKKRDGDEVGTKIRELSKEERTEAIARLLAGDKISDSHLSSARELLEDAALN